MFAAGAEQLAKGVDDRQALMIGIRCERASHRFFKRYGDRFEDSEGKQIFLEFATEEREHLELLIREYRALLDRQRRGPAARGQDPPPSTVGLTADAGSPDAGRPAAMIDLHLHTTASDGLLSPRELVERAAAAGLTTIAVTDHDTVGGLAEARRRPGRISASAWSPGSKSPRSKTGSDVHVLGYFLDPESASLGEFLQHAARRSGAARPGHRRAARACSAIGWTWSRWSRRRRAAAAASGGRRSPTRSSRPGIARIATTRSPGCSAATVRRSSRAAAFRPPRVIETIHAARRHRVARASRDLRRPTS